MTDLARTAYDGYAKSTNGKTYNGGDMLPWDDLGESIQRAWAEAAAAVIATLNTPRFCGEVFGADACDRIQDHQGKHSWDIDLVQTTMARQVNDIHGLVMSIREAMPPGMIPGL